MNDINDAYESLLQRIEDKVIKVRDQPQLVDKALEMANSMTFRRGTLLSSQEQYIGCSKAEYVKEVAKVRKEYRQSMARRLLEIRPVDDMTGRRVLVPGSYFLLPDDGPYPGLVRKWTKYKNNDLKTLWGYDISYDDGDSYYMSEQDVVRYVIPDAVSALAVADEFGMNDQDYDIVDRLEIQEEDGSWEPCTIYRHKVSKGVCLFFGGSDYEGLPDVYTYEDGVLKDSDGDDIHTREIVIVNDSESDNITTSHRVST